MGKAEIVSVRCKKRHILFEILSAVIMLLCLFTLNGNHVKAAPAAPDCNIVYDFGGGHTYTVGPALAMTMMTTNADGSYAIDQSTGYYYLDPAKMQGFFSGLQALFPASSGTAQTGAGGAFRTTAGNYLAGYNASGFQNAQTLDTAKETAYLSAAIMQGKKERHVPSYCAGGTYIEIDKTNQILYYYQNGSLVYSTPVVTGNESRGSVTPKGIYTIRNKQTNTYLNGAGYSSFVSYWMAFIGNSYGIHDASWRKNFGGQIYLTNGSHGCVNVPPANMPALYQAVAVGTPVVIY